MDATIAKIFTANLQWADAVRQSDPDFFTEGSKGQSPKVLWIGCADSRVPESVIAAAKPGDIFVHRNIANQVLPDDDSALSVLTYAIETLGVEHVVVVGHTACGGATACYKAALAAAARPDAPPPPPPDSPLARWLAPLTQLAGALRLTTVPFDEGLAVVIEENVRRQVANVVGTAPVRDAWAGGKKVWVHGWVYELENGQLKDLGVSLGPKV